MKYSILRLQELDLFPSVRIYTPDYLDHNIISALAWCWGFSFSLAVLTFESRNSYSALAKLYCVQRRTETSKGHVRRWAAIAAWKCVSLSSQRERLVFHTLLLASILLSPMTSQIQHSMNIDMRALLIEMDVLLE